MDRLEATLTGTPGETERDLFGGGAKPAWGEMEEAESESAKDKEGKLFEVDVAETSLGSIGALVLDDRLDLRVETDLEQLGCSEAKVEGDVELEAEPQPTPDWKLAGGAETSPFSSAATWSREEERRVEKDQVVELGEVGMDTSEEPRCGELSQGC